MEEQSESKRAAAAALPSDDDSKSPVVGVLSEGDGNNQTAKTTEKESSSNDKKGQEMEKQDQEQYDPNNDDDPLASNRNEEVVVEGQPPPSPDVPLVTDLAKERIPLLYYTRVQGTGIPRLPPPPRTDSQTSPTMSLPFQTKCTCSIMGRILLSSDNVSGPARSSSNTTATTTTTIMTAGVEDETTPVMTLVQQYLPHVIAAGPDQPVEIFVVVMGFADGTVAVLDAKTQALIGSQAFQIRESTSSNANTSNNNKHAVVALSMDATGSFLAAVDAGGMCTIFEMTKFQIQPAGTTERRQAPTASASDSNVFTSFMSAFTGGGSKAPTAAAAAAAATTTTQTGTMPAAEADVTSRTPTVSVVSWQTHRIPYPRNFGTPTTVALDPAYKRRREKAVLVGFADGRLVQTKRGLIFQRRTDAVLHQALPLAATDSTMAPGIQSLVWRGSLVAWAEPSGIRLFDAEGLHKIAHVDRPVGARRSLYPSVQHMTARLCFETADRLLVAWGDCLLQLTIRESSSSGGNSRAAGAAPENGNPPVEGAPVVVRRRTVECTMAWELDCIAAGVAPLDEKHVIVLGLVPNNEEENNSKAADDDITENEVELQVLSRRDGNVVYSDLLPMLKAPPEAKPKRGRNKVTDSESMAPFAILSTFNIPRMGNLDEIQTSEAIGPDFDPVALFAGGGAPRPTFRDSHLQWDLSHVSPDPCPVDPDMEKDDNVNDEDEMDDDSAASVDSDYYSFVERPFVMDPVPSSENALPPTLWTVSGADAVSARVRNLDDVISVVQDKPAVALQHALRRRAELRKNTLSDLVNRYFAAVLRLRLSSPGGKRLSLRRMKLAASAMPVLLGGSTDLWLRWVSELEDLPGALFILRTVLPVRGG